MAFHSLRDLAYDDDDMLDKYTAGSDAPQYPPGCCFSLSRDDLEKAGSGDGKPGDVMRFSAMGEVTSVFNGLSDCRVELQVGEFAGEDGKFFDLSEPTYISLCKSELGKMELEADCERGDTIHLVGEARLESHSSTEYGGERCRMQITRMTAEDESSESREG